MATDFISGIMNPMKGKKKGGGAKPPKVGHKKITGTKPKKPKGVKAVIKAPKAPKPKSPSMANFAKTRNKQLYDY